MKTVVTAAAALAGLLLAGAAAASPCGDGIAALEARLDEEARAAISASSSGKGVAATREGQAMQGGEGAEPAVPYQDQGQEARETRRAEEAGGGGDRVMQAKATLERARTLDREGDGAACQEALAEAEGQIGPD